MNSIELVSLAGDSGPPPAELLDHLVGAFVRVFRAPCRVRRDTLDIAFAFDLRRRQYYSTAILQRLQGTAGPDTLLLGVAASDLYVPVLTFVFGEAQLDGNCAVVSTARLHEEFYGLPPREDLLLERARKEAIHELGHTLGLRHCDDWRCVMASSYAVERLDIKGADFCGRCRRAMKARQERRPAPLFLLGQGEHV